jgi:hypothetical protein
VRFLAFLLIVAFYIGTAVWLIRDANRRGTNGVMIAILFGWLGPLAVLGWLAFRPTVQREIQSYTDFDNPEDALALASQLDKQGEWHAAVDLYNYVAERWPEQMNYAFACIREINAKRDLAQQ